MHWKHLKHMDDDLKAFVVLWNLYSWKRVSWEFHEGLDEQDVDEMVRPIFDMLEYDDFSTKWFKLQRFHVFKCEDILRECCGWYDVKRAEKYLITLEY